MLIDGLKDCLKAWAMRKSAMGACESWTVLADPSRRAACTRPSPATPEAAHHQQASNLRPRIHATDERGRHIRASSKVS